MANEASIATSTAWYAVIGSSSPADGAVDTGTRTAISSTSLSAAEQVYTMLEFHLDITAAATAPTENSTIDLYRIPNGNADAAETPTATFKAHYVGSFTLDNITGAQDQYLFGVANVDVNDTFITENNCGQTVTYSVNMQTRTVAPAA